MKTVFSKQLGQRIRELRLSKNLTQSALADLLWMERSNFTRIENGKQAPNAENLKKIADALGVEIKDLFDFSHFKEKKILIKEIVSALEKMSEEEVQFLYKTTMNLSQLK